MFTKLNNACEKFLDVTLQYLGHIPFDENVRKAVQKQKALLEFAPSSKASVAIRNLAKVVDQWPLPSAPTGRLEFFVERLLLAANSRSATSGMW